MVFAFCGRSAKSEGQCVSGPFGVQWRFKLSAGGGGWVPLIRIYTKIFRIEKRHEKDLFPMSDILAF